VFVLKGYRQRFTLHASSVESGTGETDFLDLDLYRSMELELNSLIQFGAQGTIVWYVDAWDDQWATVGTLYTHRLVGGNEVFHLYFDQLPFRYVRVRWEISGGPYTIEVDGEAAS
jgi:hypothetical protein